MSGRTIRCVLTCALLVMGTFQAKDKTKREEPQDDERTSPPPVEIDQVEVAKSVLESSIDPELRQELDTPHFHLVTDARGVKNAAEELGGSLEGAYYTINEVLGLPTSPGPHKVSAYFFRNEGSYRRFAGNGSDGIYGSPGLLAFFQKKGSNAQELIGVMAHEATHAFLYQFVVRPGVKIPLWLDEGFASYMGLSSVHDGRLEPGVFYRKERLDFHGGSMVTTSEARERARWLSREMTSFRFPGIERVLAADRKEFYAPTEIYTYYATAWALVHYLRHAVPDGAAKFSRLVRSAGDGNDATAALATIYGLTSADLGPELTRYVRETLAHPPDAPKQRLKKAN